MPQPANAIVPCAEHGESADTGGAARPLPALHARSREATDVHDTHGGELGAATASTASWCPPLRAAVVREIPASWHAAVTFPEVLRPLHDMAAPREYAVVQGHRSVLPRV